MSASQQLVGAYFALNIRSADKTTVGALFPSG